MIQIILAMLGAALITTLVIAGIYYIKTGPISSDSDNPGILHSTNQSEFYFADSGEWFIYDNDIPLYKEKNTDSDLEETLSPGVRVKIMKNEKKWKYVSVLLKNNTGISGWINAENIQNASQLKLKSSQ